MPISGYVPFFNNAGSVLAAVESLQRQSPSLAEIFGVDDGSTDSGASILERAGVRVKKQPRNRGRGAARDLAMRSASQPLVLCCDATNVLPRDFARRAQAWFDDPAVAAVVGLIKDPSPQGPIGRWRSRHLFKAEEPHRICHQAPLITFGTRLRATHVAQVGGFDVSLRHSEDTDLGERLLKAGFKVVGDPSLVVLSNVQNSVPQVLERYWRWYAGKEESFGASAFLRSVWFSIRTMAWNDLRHRDPQAACISLLLPAYQLWKYCSKVRVGRFSLQKRRPDILPLA